MPAAIPIMGIFDWVIGIRREREKKKKKKKKRKIEKRKFHHLYNIRLLFLFKWGFLFLFFKIFTAHSEQVVITHACHEHTFQLTSLLKVSEREDCVVALRWHCTKSSDCQVRVGGAP